MPRFYRDHSVFANENQVILFSQKDGAATSWAPRNQPMPYYPSDVSCPLIKFADDTTMIVFIKNDKNALEKLNQDNLLTAVILVILNSTYPK